MVSTILSLQLNLIEFNFERKLTVSVIPHLE